MTTDVARDGSGRILVLERLRTHAAEAAVVVAAGVAAIVLYVEGRGLSFYYDEWSFILGRRGNDLHAFLAPHNGHLHLLPIVVYRVLFATVGLEHYGPYRLAVIALHLVCAGLFFVLVRRACGRLVAVLATLLVLFLGTAWQDLLWPFQIGYLGSIAAGLGAFVALDRRDRRGDVTAASLLVVAWASSGLGIPFLVGAAVDVGWRSDRVRRAWVVGVPLVLYGVWYVAYGVNQTSLSNIRHVPLYVANSLAGTLGGLTGLGTDWGQPLAVVVGIALIVRLVGARPVPRRFAAYGATVLAFWVATALTRGQFGEPDASRYIYPGAVLLLLAGLELERPRIPSQRALAVVSVLLLAAIVGNLGVLRDGAGGLRDTSRFVDAELAAVELERSVVPPDYVADPVRAPVVTAGAYLAAVDALGSPATPLDEVTNAEPDVRAAVDGVLAHAGIRVEPGAGHAAGAAPHVDSATMPTAVGGPCVRVAAPSGGALETTTNASVEVLPRPGSSVQLAVRRLGDGFTDPVASIAKRTLVQIPRDALALPWRLELSGSGPFAVCGTS